MALMPNYMVYIQTNIEYQGLSPSLTFDYIGRHAYSNAHIAVSNDSETLWICWHSGLDSIRGNETGTVSMS